MPSHLLVLLVFSSLVSVAFATLMRDDLGSRVRFALLVFSGFVVSVVVVGWLMSPFPS